MINVTFHRLFKVVCLPWANVTQVIFDPERSGHHCRLFSSAKLFVDCAMVGWEMIDPLAAGKDFFFFFFNFQGFFLFGSNVLECAYYLFCINRFT